MISAMLIIVVETGFLVAGIVLFSRVSGLFAMESFADTCRRQQQASVHVNQKNITCPLGVHLNPINFDHLHKYYMRNNNSSII